MKLACLLALFVGFVASVPSDSRRIHIMEKFFFYHNYNIEGLLGGDRTFAPDCKNCNFNQFVEHITKNKDPFNFPEPKLTKDGMRKDALAMEKPKTLQNARKQVDIRDLMPSVSENSPDQYEELYQRTNAWVGEAQKKIDNLEGDDKKKAQSYMDAAKIAVNEMKMMRKAGYLNTQFNDAKARFAGQEYQDNGQTKKYVIDEKEIDPENNGGLTKYKELNWPAIEKRGQGNLVTEMRDWIADRNVNDRNTASHLTSEKLVDDLHKCY